jgi:hypothetical protein
MPSTTSRLPGTYPADQRLTDINRIAPLMLVALGQRGAGRSAGASSGDLVHRDPTHHARIRQARHSHHRPARPARPSVAATAITAIEQCLPCYLPKRTAVVTVRRERHGYLRATNDTKHAWQDVARIYPNVIPQDGFWCNFFLLEVLLSKLPMRGPS